jgi:hypothetical protein
VIDNEALAKTNSCNNTINISREKKIEWPDTSPPVANLAPSVLNAKHL